MNEYVPDGDWNAVRRNFLKDFIDTGGASVGVRFGVATLTFPGGSTVSDTETVAHGLGKEPVAVMLTAAHNNVHVGVTAVDATEFEMEGRTVDGSSPASPSPVNYYWLVIG